MAIRDARVVLFGATCPVGRRIVEACLALGAAEVVAADMLRTRLEELRAELGQHERLWVAESHGDIGLRALCADVARDAPVDLAVAVLQAEAPEAALRAAVFLEAAAGAVRAGGRIVLLASCEEGRAAPPALPRLIAGAPEEQIVVGVEVGREAAAGGLLERLMRLCDPAGPERAGWYSAATLAP